MGTRLIRVLIGALAALPCLAEPSPAQLCADDLKAIPSFLLENDAGAAAHLAQLGQKHFSDAFAQAIRAAGQVTDPDACDKVLRSYLKVWRKGHLLIWRRPAANAAAGPSTAKQEAPAEKNVQVSMLSQKTALIRLRSFSPEVRALLVASLREHRHALARRPNWIIDVRDNGGGSDSSFEPLLPWLLPDEFVTVGSELLATPANIRAEERVCALFAPGDPLCERTSKDALAQMRKGRPGEYVPQDDLGALQFTRAKAVEQRRPFRVAVLIDDGCISSCEEFALVARQSFSVKLIGRRTYGALDYSNLRPHELPSGQRALMYAISRSTGLPGRSVDLAGVPPDIYLPSSGEGRLDTGEIQRVQAWLEGGSLAPR